MINKRIKALILAAMVTVTSAALAGCSKSSDDELITVKESDLDSMSNEEIESIIEHNAEVLEQETSTAKEEKPAINIWDDVTITPNNDKKDLTLNFEYTGDNEDVKKAIADEKLRFFCRVPGNRKDPNGRQVTVSCELRSADDYSFNIEPKESEYTISGAAEEVYTPEQYKSITNIEEFENYCDEEIIKYALEYPTLMYTPYNEEELRNITDRRSYAGDGFCREFILPDGSVCGYTGSLYSLNGAYYIFDGDFVGYNDDRPADETIHNSFIRIE